MCIYISTMKSNYEKTTNAQHDEFIANINVFNSASSNKDPNSRPAFQLMHNDLNV